jgi:hypothetical protein
MVRGSSEKSQLLKIATVVIVALFFTFSVNFYSLNSGDWINHYDMLKNGTDDYPTWIYILYQPDIKLMSYVHAWLLIPTLMFLLCRKKGSSFALAMIAYCITLAVYVFLHTGLLKQMVITELMLSVLVLLPTWASVMAFISPFIVNPFNRWFHYISRLIEPSQSLFYANVNTSSLGALLAFLGIALTKDFFDKMLLLVLFLLTLIEWRVGITACVIAPCLFNERIDYRKLVLELLGLYTQNE